jgi:hypothetical protein
MTQQPIQRIKGGRLMGSRKAGMQAQGWIQIRVLITERQQSWPVTVPDSRHDQRGNANGGTGRQHFFASSIESLEIKMTVGIDQVQGGRHGNAAQAKDYG